LKSSKRELSISKEERKGGPGSSEVGRIGNCFSVLEGKEGGNCRQKEGNPRGIKRLSLPYGEGTHEERYRGGRKLCRMGRARGEEKIEGEVKVREG